MMPNNNVISVTIAGKTCEEFLDNFRTIAARLEPIRVSVSPSTETTQDKPASESSASAPSVNPVEIEPPKRRGRPSTKSKPAELPADSTGDMFNSKAEEAAPSMDEAKEAGRALIGSGGVDALRKVLSEFKVQKVADLKADQFADFIAQCKAI